jgi:hypothetical protein
MYSSTENRLDSLFQRVYEFKQHSFLHPFRFCVGSWSPRLWQPRRWSLRRPHQRRERPCRREVSTDRLSDSKSSNWALTGQHSLLALASLWPGRRAEETPLLAPASRRPLPSPLLSQQACAPLISPPLSWWHRWRCLLQLSQRRARPLPLFRRRHQLEHQR